MDGEALDMSTFSPVLVNSGQRELVLDSDGVSVNMSDHTDSESDGNRSDFGHTHPC